MNNRSVKSVTLQTLDETVYLRPTVGVKYEYEEQNLGDYGIGWIIYYKDGMEVGRYNIKFCVSIEWGES